MGILFLPVQVVSAETQGPFSDYHDENIIDISDVLPIVIVGCISAVSSKPGIFLAQALRQNWGGGLNVNRSLGSRLSKN